MMDALKPALLFIVTEDCYDTLFHKWDLLNIPCLSAAVSKLLGYLIIAGAVLVKLPQILKITNSQSADGISFTSICLELYAITSMLAYSWANAFPFSTWGDSFFLMIQVSFIGALVLYYTGKTSQALSFLVGYFAILYVLMSGLTPVSILATLQASNMPAVLVAKVIQALECYRNGHTGQLSAITVFLTTLGSIARIFTSIHETGDNLVVLSYCVSTFSNGLIAFQLIYYWNATTKYIKDRDSKSQ